MRQLLIAILLCVAGTYVCGQSFYVVDTHGLLYKITVDPTGVTQQDLSSCSRAITSMAKYKSTMYFTSDASFSLSKADLNGGGITNCISLGNAPLTSSLVADANGLLYLISNNGTVLNTIDPATMKLTTLGTLPYNDGGDLLFYKGELYMAAVNGIVKVNIANPKLSSLVIPSTRNIFGLAEVGYNSTQNKIYALAESSPNTDVIEVDLDTYRFGRTIGKLPYLVFDAGSEAEDGNVLPVSIDDIKISADCPFTGKGTLQVVCKNASSFYQYTLNNGTTNNTGTFTGLDPGTYTVAVTVGTEQITATKTISAFPVVKPDLIMNKTDPVCATPGQISFTANRTDAALYNIRYNNQIYNVDYTFDNLPAGTYHFIIENANGGCVADQIDVKLNQAPCTILIDKISVTEECKSPGKANVTVMALPGPDIYTYNLNNAVNMTGIFDDIPMGSYTLKVTSSGGGTTSIPVNVPDYSITNAKVTYLKKDGICEITGDIKFKLSVEDSQYSVLYDHIIYPFNYDFSGLTEGIYHFSILKPTGCVLAQLDIPITKGDCQAVTFPNTFSPNGDGVNDIFRPGQNSHPPNFKLYIYNRLGSLIFKSNDATVGWDGQLNGKPAPTGTYYWTAVYTEFNQKVALKSGYVALIR